MSEKWRIGDKILDRYQIQFIKKGGMGIVFLCYDHVGKVPIAIKTFQDKFLKDTTSVERFRVEAETWVRLEKHKNIVRALYVDKIQDRPYIFLEYIVGHEELGTDLSGWISCKKMDVRLCLDFTIQFCSGMIYAQKKFEEMSKIFVHRDIKPRNILVTRDMVIKVTDFGIVKTSYGIDTIEAIGTPSYMAPEQWLDENTDQRTDIYAFGCTLYEMLTGRPPFICDEWQEYRSCHLKKKPERLKSQIPNVPEELDSLVMKCIEKEPDNRHPTFVELRGQLEKLYYKITGEEFVLKETPNSLNNRELLAKGASLDNLGYHQEALGFIEQAINSDPKFLYAFHSRAVVYLGLEEYGKAIEEYNHILKTNVLKAVENRLYYDRGYALSKIGKYRDALCDYNKAIELGLNTSAVYNERGCIFADLNEHHCALKDFEHALTLCSSFELKGSIYFNKGLVHNKIHEYQDAIECFDKVIEIKPEHVKAYANRGNSNANLCQYNTAIKDYKKAAELNPSSTEKAEIYRNLGLIYYRMRYYDDAISNINCAVNINTGDIAAYLTLGNIYGEIGKLNDAIAIFNKVLELDQKNILAYYNRGLSYAYLNKHMNAVRDFDKLIEFDPKSYVGYCERGLVYQYLGNTEQAIRDYTNSIMINPEYGKAYGGRGAAYASLKKYKQAVMDYDKFIELAPQDLKEQVEQAKAAVLELKRMGN